MSSLKIDSYAYNLYNVPNVEEQRIATQLLYFSLFRRTLHLKENKMAVVTDIVLFTAQKLGGALVRIMGDRKELERFAASKLDDETALAITKTVIENPELNTDKRIGSLLWLASFHGEPIDKWLIELSQQYTLEDILLVIEFLYEIAVRNGKDSLDEESNEGSRESVEYLLEFLEIYRQLDNQPDILTIEKFSDLVEKLGGLNEVLGIDTRDALEAKLYDTDE